MHTEALTSVKIVAKPYSGKGSLIRHYRIHRGEAVSVLSVGRALVSTRVLVLTRDSILERSRINVRSVGKPLTTAPILISTIEPTLGKSPIGVAIVGKPFSKSNLSKHPESPHCRGRRILTVGTHLFGGFCFLSLEREC